MSDPSFPSSSISEIPDDKKESRDWTILLDRVEFVDLAIIQIVNPRVGVVTYGMTPDGHDGWNFHEVGGGGSVIVPYAVWKKELFIGVIKQDRPNQGGNVLQLPRGLLDAGEDHFDAALRELSEEIGNKFSQKEIMLLGGDPCNPNSTFFVTTPPDEGVRFYAIQFRSNELMPLMEGEGYTLQPGLLKESATTQATEFAERILGCQFIPWPKAAQLGDMFTVAGVGRLLAHLKNNVRHT